MASTYEGLNKVYKELTGIVHYDFQTLSDAVVGKTDAERERLYHDVIWHIPGGRYLEVDPYKSKNAYIVNSAAQIAGVTLVKGTDIDRDQDIDVTDSNIFSYATPMTAHTITFSYGDKGSETRNPIEFKGEYKFTKKDLTYFKNVTEGDVTYTQSKWQTTIAGSPVDVHVGDSTPNDATLTAIWEVKA